MDYSKQTHLHDFYTVDTIIQSVRKTFLKKKEEMVDTLKRNYD